MELEEHRKSRRSVRDDLLQMINDAKNEREGETTTTTALFLPFFCQLGTKRC